MDSRARHAAVKRKPHRAPQRARAAVGRRLLAGAMSAAVLIGVGGVWYIQSDLTSGLNRSDALSALGADAGSSLDGDTNILLIGLDSRKAMDGSDLPAEFVTEQLHAGDSDVGGYNTNTLILLHVPGDGSKASAVAIPRDDYVAVPGYGMAKIKEAYGMAKADADAKLVSQGITDPAVRETKAREAGRRSTLATVQNLLKVPIDHFAEVNLIGFYDVVSAIGPIQVCLNNAVQDDFSGANFPAGVQTLNASQALSFVRQRHGLDNGDLDRTHRQQAFISAVITNLKSSGVMGNIPKMTALADVVKKDIVIDSAMDPVKFATQATALAGGNIDFHTLPIEGYQTINGQDVNTVNPARLRKEVASIFAGNGPVPQTPDPSLDALTGSRNEKVDVRNGTAVDGLAASYAATLTARSIVVGEVATGPSTATTTVTYGVGAEAVAQALAAELGISAVADNTLTGETVSVLIGEDNAQSMFVAPVAAPTSIDPIPDSGPQGAPLRADANGGIPCVD
ncbi:LCP family protein required for cell wall assembly [Rhodococcus sp. 27YEA15]|uniref:LCP family protein n=1 Tax=Rhodococcus sp. 27YEA15 TaxID=3156259 RepID=UPI003C7CB188